jgi:hypothetical protein
VLDSGAGNSQDSCYKNELSRMQTQNVLTKAF